jgi:uncharacterized protein (UPF0332 family)
MENYRSKGADEYAAQSRHFVRQAQEELDSGDRLQASEKAWGAAAHAVKAVAAKRGWNHNSHRLLFDVIDQLARDSEAPALRSLFQTANSLHQNFYEDWQPDGLVQDGINEIRQLVDLLDAIRAQPAKPSVVVDPRQWDRLTRTYAE